MQSELIPNRIFVGGLPLSTTEHELVDYFTELSGKSHIKDAKIITDPNSGTPKGYGFITFNNESEATKILSLKSDSII